MAEPGARLKLYAGASLDSLVLVQEIDLTVGSAEGRFVDRPSPAGRWVYQLRWLGGDGTEWTLGTRWCSGAAWSPADRGAHAASWNASRGTFAELPATSGNQPVPNEPVDDVGTRFVSGLRPPPEPPVPISTPSRVVSSA